MLAKKFSRRFIAAALAVGAFTFMPNFYHSPLIQVAQAEIKTYTGTSEYIMSDSETQDFAKEGAKMHATRAAQEKAGVFVASHSRIKNNILEDEIETFTASIVKFIGEPKFEPVLIQANDKKTYIKFIATVTVAIDTDDLDAQIDKWLNRDGRERSNFVDNNKYLQQIIDNQAKQIARLEEIISNTNSTQDTKNIQSELQKIDKETLYVQKLALGNKLFFQDDYEAAVNAYSEAIEVKPNAIEAHLSRFLAKASLVGFDYDDCQKHLIEVNKIIQMNPKYPQTYAIRSIIYTRLSDFGESEIYYLSKALDDLNTSLKLNNPDKLWIYLAQAQLHDQRAYIAHLNDDDKKYIKEKKLAIKFISKAISIQPNFYQSYKIRADYYESLEDYQKAIEDYTKAIEVHSGTNESLARLYRERADIYYTLKQYDKAIYDCTKSIDLNPNDSNFSSYKIRLWCYKELGETEKAHADLIKMRELGAEF